MIQAARRRCSINLRILLSDRSGSSCEYRSLSSSATIFMEHTSAVHRPRAWSLKSSTSSVMPSACGRHYSPWPSSQASIMVNRRTMSTTKGRPTAGTVPGMIKGFGLRQKAPDTGNSALGKGFDIMEDDVGSRKKVVIAGYDPHGFQLGDGVDVRGSMICFPNSFVLWRPKRAKDITVESLHILDLVTPKIDIVVVGVGERMTERLDPALIKHLRSKKISVELMDTVNACSTFNVLNAEDRRVAAALLQLSETEEEA